MLQIPSITMWEFCFKNPLSETHIGKDKSIHYGGVITKTFSSMKLLISLSKNYSASLTQSTVNVYINAEGIK